VNARQYNQLRENLRDARRMSAARGLDELSPRAARRRAQGERWMCSPLAREIKEVARALRDRQAAEAAWERVARPPWREHTRVESAVAGLVELGVDNPTLLYELGRQKAALERQIRQLAPGCQRRKLRLVDMGVGPTDLEERGQ